MSRLSKFTIAAIGTLAITGCATMNVSSHVQRGLDVSRYHTYDWGPADALPAGDRGSSRIHSSRTISAAKWKKR